MQKLEYQVSFNTPAFLGNAEQQAQWRTPPFKALLRQWWRVVKANELLQDGFKPGVLHGELLRRENKLFGAAADEGSQRSQVRLRLSAWNQGNLKQWYVNEPKTTHPEVNFSVGTDIYLGYGPLGYDKTSKSTQLGEIRGTAFKRTSIEDTAEATFSVMSPEEFKAELVKSIQLAAWFGVLGSRSRNGWGSLHIKGDGIENLENAKLAAYLRPLEECLKLDWPHAIGSMEGKSAIWMTRVNGSWREVMKELARIKIAFRTQFKFTGGGPHADFQERQLLAYPITRHSHQKWGNEARLANQLRFKVFKKPDGKLTGLISHLPCTLPDILWQKLNANDQQFVRNNELAIWQQVHTKLNELCELLA